MCDLLLFILFKSSFVQIWYHAFSLVKFSACSYVAVDSKFYSLGMQLEILKIATVHAL